MHKVDEPLKLVKIRILVFDISFGPWISPSNNMHVVLGETLPPSSSKSKFMAMIMNVHKEWCRRKTSARKTFKTKRKSEGD